MWSIKFLSGPKKGKEIFLQPGLTLLGRAEDCQISIPSQGLSKRHAKILIRGDSLIIEDMKSRNGIFIRGKQIVRRELKEGDRVALSDVIFEIKKRDSLPGFNIYGLPSYQDIPQPDLLSQKASKNLIDAKGGFIENIKKITGAYVDNVVLPGVYKLAEWMEFRFIVASFVIGFIILVTVLSSFPLLSILKSSVERESLNNAENIAITLAQANRSHLKKGLSSAVSVDYALRRPGVKKAYIISARDGRILAPEEIAHTYPKSSLIHKARKKNEKTVEKMDSSSIAAIVPINFYNPDTGESLPRAYSVVIYDVSSLAVGVGRSASLLIQSFFIACVIGFLLFFFLIKLIEFPIQSLNSQLGQALKDEKAPSLSLNYQSQILADLCSHINSALNQISLNRLLNEKEEDGNVGEINRQNEMNNLVEIVGFPALSINLDEEIIASLNSNWTEQIGFSEILHQPLAEISDSYLRDHLLGLVEQGKSNSQEIIFGEINLNHIKLQSACQFVMGKSAPAYAIVTFMPPPEEEEGAA